MATLYVQNIPDELYEALREQAQQHRKSIAAEILTLLEESIPTPRELRARQEFLRRIQRIRARKPRRPGSFPSSEEMQREDRSR